MKFPSGIECNPEYTLVLIVQKLGEDDMEKPRDVKT
jgi:hypothetical protein